MWSWKSAPKYDEGRGGRSDGGRNKADRVAEAEDARHTSQSEPPNPAKEAEDSEMRDLLQKTVDRLLTARQRDVILMRYGGTRAPWPQVAEALGVSEDTAQREEGRALKKLRKVMRPSD